MYDGPCEPFGFLNSLHFSDSLHAAAAANLHNKYKTDLAEDFTDKAKVRVGEGGL